MRKIAALAAATTLTFNTVASAAPGDLDPTFGYYPYWRCPDLKIVVFGTNPYSYQTGWPTKYKLIRYLP